MAGTVFRSLGEVRAALGDEAAKFSDEALLKAVAESTGKPLGYVADSLGYDPGSGSMWGERVSSAIDRYQSGLYDFMGTKVGRAVLGLPSMVSSVLPGDPLGTFMDSRRAANDVQAQVAAERAQGLGAVDSYKDVDWLSPSSVGNYAGGLAVQSAPYLAEAVAGGIVGRGLMTGSRAALTAARLSGDVKAAADATRALRAGSTAGAVAASYPSSVGDIMSNMREESGFVDENAALGLGIPYAAANAFGLEGLAARGVLPRAINLLDRPGGFGGAALRATVGGVGTAASEGFNETLQEFTNQIGRRAVNPDAELFGPDALERYKESFIGGAMLGQAGHTTLGGWRRSEGYKPQVDLLQGETPDAPAAPPLALGWNGVGPNSQAMSAGYGPDATVYPAGVDPRYAYGPQGALFASNQQPEPAEFSGPLVPDPITGQMVGPNEPGYVELVKAQGSRAPIEAVEAAYMIERAQGAQMPTGATGPALPDNGLFANAPSALIRSEYSTPAILRELTQLTGERPTAQLVRAANKLSTMLETTPSYKVEQWLADTAARSNHPDTINLVMAMADIANRHRQVMQDALNQEGASPQTEQQDRMSILNEVLSDPQTRNPTGRFTAELKKRGMPNLGILPEEAQRISDHEAGYTGGGEVVSRGGLLVPTTAAPATATVGTPAQAGTSPATPIQAAPAAPSAAPPLGPDTPSPTRSVPTAVIPQVAKPVIEQVAPTPPAPVPVAPPAAPSSRTPASSANPAPGGAAPAASLPPRAGASQTRGGVAGALGAPSQLPPKARTKPTAPKAPATWYAPPTQNAGEGPVGSYAGGDFTHGVGGARFAPYFNTSTPDVEWVDDRNLVVGATVLDPNGVEQEWIVDSTGKLTADRNATPRLYDGEQHTASVMALVDAIFTSEPGSRARAEAEAALAAFPRTAAPAPIGAAPVPIGAATAGTWSDDTVIVSAPTNPKVVPNPKRTATKADAPPPIKVGPEPKTKVKAKAQAPATVTVVDASSGKYDGLAVEIPVAANGKSVKIKFKDAGKTMRQMDDKISKLEALRKCLL